MILDQAVRVMIFATIAFLAALAVTPLWQKWLMKRGFAKQLRNANDAPVFYELHKKKIGVPTGAGIIIWSTVLGLAIIFGILNHFFDSHWQYFNFIDRGETYLPLAALFLAALAGFIDDWLGVKRLGGASGGGLKVRQKSLFYVGAAAVGAWWFFFRLQWDVLNVPFVGNIQIGWWYIPFFIFIVFASAFSANETDGLDGLLGGSSLFAFVALTAVAFFLGRYELAAFS